MRTLPAWLALLGLLSLAPPVMAQAPRAAGAASPFLAERLLDVPLIHAGLHGSLGPNIQGPSLIRVPDWVPNPLGKYYLYFADHKGAWIRLAYADALTGPWRIHAPGSLQLKDSGFPLDKPHISPEQMKGFEERIKASGVRFSHDLMTELTSPHIASPDVHVDHERREIIMYFHGLHAPMNQFTRVARSSNGIDFQGQGESLGPSYFRVFRHGGWHYALAMPGVLLRSRDGLSGFERGPTLFNRNMRHSAVLLRGQSLWVFWTQVGDAPERILVSRIDLRGDWMGWKDEQPHEILRPERPWEGALAPVEPSVRSSAYGLVNQLRDPAIFEEDGTTYLLYAFGGESGIAVARLRESASGGAR